MCWMVVPLCIVTGTIAAGQTLTTLANFDGANGSGPAYMSLVQGLDGNYYGTTEAGGSNYSGTVFKITPAGTLTTLYSFCLQVKCADGSSPEAGLVLATDGNFYGTTAAGGAHQLGTVFKITAAGELTTLYNFCSQANCSDGSNPYAPLIQGIDGNFYGTTYFGLVGNGTVFRMTPGGELTTLHSFNGIDGASPSSALVQASNGNFYGVASAGGQYQFGTAFEMTPTGKFTTLQNFGDGDGYAVGGLIEATDGNLYGTTAIGGSIGAGTIFKMTLDGTLTTLHSFDFTDGYLPEAALVEATDGNLYGTTIAGGILTCSGSEGEGCGTIFEITLDGALTSLYEFCSHPLRKLTPDCPDGSGPNGLLQATSGTFYGATSGGGSSPSCKRGCGTVFSLEAGLEPFVKSVPGAGKVGAEVGILGTNLTGASAVTFNGTPAQFSVRSPSLIVTHVPSGATTGKISVTLPDGTFSTIPSFYVLR